MFVQYAILKATMANSISITWLDIINLMQTLKSVVHFVSRHTIGLIRFGDILAESTNAKYQSLAM